MPGAGVYGLLEPAAPSPLSPLQLRGCDEFKTYAEQHYLAPADKELRGLHL